MGKCVNHNFWQIATKERKSTFSKANYNVLQNFNYNVLQNFEMRERTENKEMKMKYGNEEMLRIFRKHRKMKEG